MSVLGFGNEGQLMYRDENGEVVVDANNKRIVTGEPNIQKALELIEAAMVPKF